MEQIRGYRGLGNIIAFVAAFYVFRRAFWSPLNEAGVIYGIEGYNLIVYAGVVLLIFAVCLLWRFAENALPEGKLWERVACVVYLAFGTGLLFFLYMVYEKETTLPAGEEMQRNFVREQVGHFSFTCVMLFFIFAFWAAVRKRDADNRFAVAVSLQIALGGAIFSYAPNIFRNTIWGVEHIHAYTNSIVNVMRLSPYDNAQYSIYGFYGIVYYPFVKLLGDDMRAVSLVISLFTFFTYVAFFYAAWKLIKNRMLFGVAVVAAGGMSVTFYCLGQYYQGWPHRYLFPALSIALMAWQVEKGGKQKWVRIVEWVLGSTAVMFNLESGFCTVMTIAAYHFFEKQCSLLEMIKKAFTQVLYGAGCFFLAYGMVNSYNLLVGGGTVGIKRFIYPFMSGIFDMRNLRTMLPTPFSNLFVEIVLFGLVAIRSVQILWSKEATEGQSIKLAFAVSGLSGLIYSMNRATSQSAVIAHIQLVILLGSCSAEFWNAEKEELEILWTKPEQAYRLTISFVACLLVTWLAIEGSWSVGRCLEDRAGGAWNTDALYENLEVLKQEIPEDTLAFGMGIPEIFYQMGRDPQIAIGDWTGVDINHYMLKEVNQKVEAADAFVVMDGTNYEIPEDFRAVKQLPVEPEWSTCTYYERISKDR